MVEGGRSEYFMTGPNGERHGGYLVYESVEPGRGFRARDGFATDEGSPNDELPTMVMEYRFEATDTGSRMTGVTTFPSLEAMEQLVEMGMIEGSRAALGQLPDVLADLASFAQGRAVDARILTDTRVRFSRIISGSVEQVWRAHHDAELMQRWMLGPDGSETFGFEGEVIESTPPRREVTTEAMIGLDMPPNRNEMTLTPADGGTLLSLVVTYASKEIRDQVLETDMTDGMEASYARLESSLASVAR